MSAHRNYGPYNGTYHHPKWVVDSTMYSKQSWTSTEGISGTVTLTLPTVVHGAAGAPVSLVLAEVVLLTSEVDNVIAALQFHRRRATKEYYEETEDETK